MKTPSDSNFVPTVGQLVHAPSTALTDSLVLSSYNGQSQLWFYFQLNDGELSEFYSVKPRSVPDFLQRRGGRDAYLGVAQQGRLAYILRWKVPNASPQDLVGLARKSVEDKLMSSLESTDKSLSNLVQVVRDMQEAREASSCP